MHIFCYKHGPYMRAPVSLDGENADGQQIDDDGRT